MTNQEVKKELRGNIFRAAMLLLLIAFEVFAIIFTLYVPYNVIFKVFMIAVAGFTGIGAGSSLICDSIPGIIWDVKALKE